jgi:hypothetical protein
MNARFHPAMKAVNKDDLHRINSWSQDQQGIVKNAFVFACMHRHIDAAKLLLEKGTELSAIPGGFDFAGTGLHYAALKAIARWSSFS